MFVRRLWGFITKNKECKQTFKCREVGVRVCVSIGEGNLSLWSSRGSIGDMLRHHQYWQAVVMYWLQVIQMPVTVSLHRRIGGEQHSIFCTTMTIMVGFTLSRCKLASEWNWTFSSKATLILTQAWGFRMIGLRNGSIVLDSWGQVVRTYNFRLTFSLVHWHTWAQIWNVSINLERTLQLMKIILIMNAGKKWAFMLLL